MTRSALLIIDMQNDFVREGAPFRVREAEATIGNVREVLEIFRRNRLPVFHVLRVHRSDGSDVELFRKELFRKTPFAVSGTKGAQVISELEPAPGEYIIKKTRMSAFMQTELDLMLRTLSVDTVFVAGIQTPNCIRTTVFDALALNYRAFLVEDAVAAQNEEIHRSNCRDMAAIGVGMLKAADVEELIRPAR
ncbi:MAG TPA: isochorismatase family cysteine hydrolase [Methanoregulaceae archaeon]|nr:MAG: cysteine hydrolase [Methanolinea sp.]HON82118.1 isochorismatase family cysteine hydrolase [Methanoregulaceae archaeon]HPD10818.1 isochorismatase family cysteine hydrolase [Methanoregulaceae archaeon]HRT16004.1 isochorismatase family cysteine hydrolase [Methanoregulaceae archaeon]HRU31469.1 isochorismatase family cysteine hydrolase [Methanoregulaceae archaeon]